jgi:hypothetical protein
MSKLRAFASSREKFCGFMIFKSAAGIEERDSLLFEVVAQVALVFNAVGFGGHGRFLRLWGVI